MAIYKLSGDSSGIGLPINISDVSNLQTNLDSKAPTTHSHPIAEINGLQNEISRLDSRINNAGSGGVALPIAISDVTNLQTNLDSKAPTTHSHPIAEINGLQTTIDGLAAQLNPITSFSIGQTGSGADYTQLADIFGILNNNLGIQKAVITITTPYLDQQLACSLNRFLLTLEIVVLSSLINQEINITMTGSMNISNLSYFSLKGINSTSLIKFIFTPGNGTIINLNNINKVNIENCHFQNTDIALSITACVWVAISGTLNLTNITQSGINSNVSNLYFSTANITATDILGSLFSSSESNYSGVISSLSVTNPHAAAFNINAAVFNITLTKMDITFSTGAALIRGDLSFLLANKSFVTFYCVDGSYIYVESTNTTCFYLADMSMMSVNRLYFANTGLWHLHSSTGSGIRVYDYLEVYTIDDGPGSPLIATADNYSFIQTP